MKFALTVAALATVALGACSSTSSPRAADPGYPARVEIDTAIVLVPGTGAPEQVAAGCWATFFDERSFGGSSLTLVGPTELSTLDKGAARQLKRDIKSIATGPRATLVLYEKQFLSARSVGFPPGSREAGLAEKLGFGGRIESMQLRCN